MSHDAEARIGCTTDKSTLASVTAFSFKHLSLSLSVDFATKEIAGTATWTVIVAEAAEALVLDTTAGLAVTAATVNGHTVECRSLAPHECLGTPLAVPVPEAEREPGNELTVSLTYSTSPQSSALQWLPPAQTAGKQRPYMFSQCQAIHARALFPCADAPTCKFTYDAEVTVPAWATALMSAEPQGGPQEVPASDGSTRRFAFQQDRPVPSYLVAVAVGELGSKRVGPRTTVWAEPCMVEAVAWEFGETERFIATAEDLTGHAYDWSRYDILCMPPSFPYGGMENPCLTFATPTLLAGDRSLANVICHEVAHGWTGNLVTNHTWEHFWLNEGWTRWLENRVLTRLSPHGEELYNFQMQESLTHLEEAVSQFGATSPLTALVPPLDGIDPDDAFSAVPYEKGLALLNHLTSVAGGHAKFETFAKAYIAAYARRTLTSADFRAFFCEWCGKEGVDCSGVEWEKWLLEPGMPDRAMQGVYDYPDTLGAKATQLVERWVSCPEGQFAAEEYAALPPPLKTHFLESLLARSHKAGAPLLPLAALQRMDELYQLTDTRNAELRCRWQRVCLCHRAAFIVPEVVDFVATVGRMKFVRPLYRELFAWEEQSAVAVRTFMQHRDGYHPICSKMLSADLKLDGKSAKEQRT
uniref:Peptidase M1 leukotriene A4 hydrolase/aminopeptidase C-terminal domain-containing protein n=2 Tax=Emiliania huxleyi TaxID=2903 RepID=A0A7S3RQH5_EMIHU|mmetsp:Transcript_11723/g.34630  ORF Transcript_11723/g.34630 Transcript_11723/m.34630 type:complete len:641 (+) Transcript_11723:109-2031(+)